MEFKTQKFLKNKFQGRLPSQPPSSLYLSVCAAGRGRRGPRWSAGGAQAEPRWEPARRGWSSRRDLKAEPGGPALYPQHPAQCPRLHESGWRKERLSPRFKDDSELTPELRHKGKVGLFPERASGLEWQESSLYIGLVLESFEDHRRDFHLVLRALGVPWMTSCWRVARSGFLTAGLEKRGW